MSSNFEEGLRRVSAKETSNQPQGRSGAQTPVKKFSGGNKIKGGGIVSPTKGKS